MNTPDTYIILGSIDELSDVEEFGLKYFSNLEWGKQEARKMAETRRVTQTIYKLVPVFEAKLEVTTRVIERDLTPPPDDRRDWDAADEAERERERGG